MIYHPECFFRDDITDLVVFTTLVSVFMLMADGTGGDQIVLQCDLLLLLIIPLGDDRLLDASLVGDV